MGQNLATDQTWVAVREEMGVPGFPMSATGAATRGDRFSFSQQRGVRS